MTALFVGALVAFVFIVPYALAMWMIFRGDWRGRRF